MCSSDLVYIKKITKLKNKFKILININKQQKKFFVKSIFESNLKNMLAAITVISIFRDIKKLNENIFYDFVNPKGRGDISTLGVLNGESLR